MTSSVFPVGSNDATASVFADNDGDLDLIMSRRFRNPTTGQTTSKHTGIEFYINQDVGRTFQALGADYDLGRDETPHGGLTRGDVDLDGDLDVIFTHNGGGNGIGGIGSSFKSGLPLNAHFGLGTATVADEVRVRWPSGVVTVLTNVAADQRIQVAE